MQRNCVAAAAALLALAAAMNGQSIGASVSGRVSDEQGLAVRDARVELTGEKDGRQWTVDTDASGLFRFTALAQGRYFVQVSKDGFQSWRSSVLDLNVGDNPSLQATLRVAAVQDTVTVVSETAVLLREDSDTSTTYTSRLMNDLPMLAGGVGRNFRTQVFLTPGVTPATTAHRPFAVNGMRTRNNNYLIDSNDFNEIEGGLLMGRASSEQLLSTEAIDGMQVLTHNFKAEYGRQNGSVISIVTKRGTNDWHGLLYEYLRNDKLDARNTFDVQRPPLRFNQFGFNLGGPAVRNRTFFFVNSEWFIRRQTNTTTVQTLTPAQRAQAAPAVAPLVALYPQPNVPGSNLNRANVPTTGEQWSGVFRVDHDISSRQRLFVRSTVLDSINRGVAGAAFSRFNTSSIPQGHSLQHTWTLKPSILNEARLNYTRFSLNDDFVDPVQLGDPSVNGSVGTVFVNGLSQLGQFSFMARQTAQNNYQFSDDLSMFRGRHSLKTGFAVRRLQLNSGTFAPSYTGVLRFNSIADFLSGRPAAYSRNVGNPYIGLRATEYNAYVQDDWKIHPRLTLNLGLRYEYNTVPSEVNSLIRDEYRFRPDRNNLAPRFGFAWTLDRDANTVLRGGYGIYYNVIELSFVGLTRFNPPLIATFAAANPRFPDLLAGGSQSIPSGLVRPDPDARQPYAQHLNLSLERRLGMHSLVSAAYVGTLGRKLPRASRPNGGDGLPQAQRPDPSIGVLNRLETAALSNYHGLQLQTQTQFRGITLRGSYTYSKSIDETSDFPSGNTNIDRAILALDEQNWRLNRGVADFDIRQVATGAWVWDLPLFRTNRWLGGWQLMGIYTAQSGRPYTLFSGTDNLIGTNNNRILELAGTLVRGSASLRRPIELAPGATRAQITPARGQLGTIGRNTERGDLLLSMNASVSKGFAISERWKLQFRAETFNLFNTVNYQLPDGVLTSPNFGAAIAAFDPRQVQLALRLSF
jgi:hypothetical protein